jgi:predicted ArsR family transcriptional regulator
MHTTHQRISDYLRTYGAASAVDLSQALHLTAANIRHHLNRMLADQVVEYAGHPPGEGRGRPVDLFRLSLQARPHNLAGLAQALLHSLYARTDPSDRPALMAALAGQIANQCPPVAGALTQRLAKTVGCLKALNYQPRWEARKEGPRFMFAACPYAAVLPTYPELCQMDSHLLEMLLVAPIRQTARLEAGAPPARFCIFLIDTP